MSSYEINKNNIALENNADMYLQHDVIAGVRDENDPRTDIEASGIPNDDLVGVPIVVVNDEQQQELENNDEKRQELENNENAIQQIDNNNYISDDEGDVNNQPDYYLSDDAQTENEPDKSNTDEDEVDKGITENTESGVENENANKDESKDDDDDNNYQPDGPRRSKRNNKGILKAKGPYQFENSSVAHRANENARKWDNYMP